MTKDVPFIQARSHVARDRADSSVVRHGRVYHMTAERTDDGMWVGKCRELPDWTDKALTLDALEQALCDEVAGL